MSELPADLVPLPTQPFDERPVSIPLTVDEARTALWRKNGNVTEAAKLLKVRSSRLRAFIATSPFLIREQEEAREQIVDVAEAVVAEALRDPERSDSMARFVLSTQGKKRGWGTGAGNSVSITNTQNNTVIQWGNGETIAVPLDDGIKTING